MLDKNDMFVYGLISGITCSVTCETNGASKSGRVSDAWWFMEIQT